MHAFFDSHAHLSSEALYQNVAQILKRAQEKNVTAIMNICTDELSLTRGLELSTLYPWIYQAGATTPHDVEKEGEQMFAKFASCARAGKLQAIGETGLDYYYSHSDRSIQQVFLRRYLKLALECHLPVIIHCRDAFADFFKIIDQEDPHRSLKGVLHCFTGTAEEAEELVQRGWMISLSGIVTFKKALSLQEIAKQIPLKQLLIETDSPYLAPQKERGKINEPSFVVQTAAFLADLKNISLEQLAKQTSTNAYYLFKIKNN